MWASTASAAAERAPAKLQKLPGRLGRNHERGEDEGRRSGDKIQAYPGPKPADPREAFAIQCKARELLGWQQRGWKVGCTSEIAQKAPETPDAEG